MENPVKIFQCLLCKKFKNIALLESRFDDGSPMCKDCGNEIRAGFYYYIDGKEAIPCHKCDGLGFIDQRCELPYPCDQCPIDANGLCNKKCPDCNGLGYRPKDSTEE